MLLHVCDACYLCLYIYICLYEISDKLEDKLYGKLKKFS